VMKCIVEVISDTLSKPNPLPISEECLETLRGDERIISILRHQNLLKELQEIAVQGNVGFSSLFDTGASERSQQQKKNSGFEDELSEVLESQNDKNKQRGQCQPNPQKIQQNKREDPKEEGKNSLEEREARPREVRPGEKRDPEEAESNEIGGTEDSQREEVLDNRISEDLGEEEQKEREEEEEQRRGTGDSLELEEEGEQMSRQGQEESKEETGGRTEREDEQGDSPVEEDPTEAERSLDLAEEEVESEVMPRDDDNEEALGFGKDERSSEEEEEQRYRLKGGRHHLGDEAMQAEEDAFQSRDVKSEEMEEESSREWEDSKRWNKMDELAKQLTSKKHTEENDSGEDPDRSMKMVFRSHKYDFSSPEEDVRRSWKRHSKEDSSEGFPLAPMPEEKKDEEGSANRRTEDQELESLAAIEAELERVAHKLHELRRG
ncbi:CMGA protein, partial [Eudromia elegans]|nr:CMGA protein [Eudromia elegans]